MVAVNGASITLIGAKTTVHHNCTKGNSGNYGFHVFPTATIQLVSPLTKEQVSIDNGGGGNWGVSRGANINQIKTIDGGHKLPTISSHTSSCAACNTPQTTTHPLKRCKCHSVYYCNSTCQKAHWVPHQEEHRRLVQEKKAKKNAGENDK